jgi:hypothetical protein
MKTEFFRWNDQLAHPTSRKNFLQLNVGLVFLIFPAENRYFNYPPHTTQRLNETPQQYTAERGCVRDLFLFKRAIFSLKLTG